MSEPLDKRLLFVTGKGGTGKSTVAAALGIVAARRGLRTMVAEIAGQHRLARSFGLDPPGFEEVEVAPRLFTTSVDPERTLEEYLRLRAGRLGALLSGSRTFGYLTAATPGLRELLSLGKVWELAQPERRTRGAARYDLVVLDAPASGHGLGLMRTPDTFAQVARTGPLAQHARRIAETVRDPGFTGVLAVARPEEMPVTETLALHAALRDELGLQPDRLVVNAVYPDRFAPRDCRAIERALAPDGAPAPAARAALRAALSARARTEVQRAQLRRLARGTGMTPLTLPFVFEPELGPPELERLAGVLEAGL